MYGLLPDHCRSPYCTVQIDRESVVRRHVVSLSGIGRDVNADAAGLNYVAETLTVSMCVCVYACRCACKVQVRVYPSVLHQARLIDICSLPFDSGRSLRQVGNGVIGFNADATGMQSLNETYTVFPLATLSDWGWHSSPPPQPSPFDTFT